MGFTLEFSSNLKNPVLWKESFTEIKLQNQRWKVISVIPAGLILSWLTLEKIFSEFSIAV